MKKISFLCFLFSTVLYAQENIELTGNVIANKTAVPFANISVENSSVGTAADINGNFHLTVKSGIHTLIVQAVGFKSLKKEILTENFSDKSLNFELTEDLLGLDEVVISATRNRVEAKKTPVIVSVLDRKVFDAVHATSVCESLSYQSGVRVETNCQNCGFTQVRLNGLDGGYTQILVNNRAVFSALNSVYGLEQIPTAILDRIEVVRSGGSALYGANAIAGTVNIITKEPTWNTWEISGNLSLIDGVADKTVNLSTSVVSEDAKSGITAFGMRRNRDAYDANEDGFSEITTLTNTTFGTKAFLKPSKNSKLSLDFTALEEYRRGGDRLDLAPHFTDITEELTHHTFLGGLTYDLHNADKSNALSVYTSTQSTERKSFYGGLGGGRTAQDSISAANAYGNTDDLAWLAGAQFTRKFTNQDELTLGAEYNANKVDDNIPGYNRSVNQEVNTFGAYAQYEWKPTKKITALLGGRLDYVSVEGNYDIQNITRKSTVQQAVFNPRITLLYNLAEYWQFRGGYARGFRAPQAFNEDMHISSVGGEPQFVVLSENLKTEYSNAYTASVNFTKTFSNIQTNFLLEGFYTDLKNPFTSVSTGASLPNGSILEEVRNGNGAYVAGTSVEIGISPSPKFRFQLGGTFQKSVYKKNQTLFEAAETNSEEHDIQVNEFVRNPNTYGYLNTNVKLFKETSLDLTGTYTGKMTIPKVVSNTGFLQLNKSEAFYDINLKLSQHTDITDNFQLTVFGGIQNIFNSYQRDFDAGPTRDSDYIYGPSKPRTFFIGVKFGTLHL